MKYFISSIFFLLSLLAFTGKKPIPQPRFDYKKLEKSLVSIPAGSFYYGLEDTSNNKGSTRDHVLRNARPSFTIVPEPRMITLKSYHISKYEVSNANYLVFLSDIKTKVFARYNRMLPDTIRDTHCFSEPLLEGYFYHPGLYDFPTVGISYEQANAYCEWLTEQYQKEEKRKFEYAVFKLPTIGQWTYAANGGADFTLYPPGQSLQDRKGSWTANFTIIDQKNIGQQIMSRDSAWNTRIFTANPRHCGLNTKPVNSFPPNTFGLHNMAGNVEEYVREKGITKGGSWMDPGFYLQTWVEERYDSTNIANDERGFRIVMELEE